MSKPKPSNRVSVSPPQRSDMEKERLERSKQATGKSLPSVPKSLGPVQIYLVGYNVICTILWGYILVLTVSHILSGPRTSIIPTKGPSPLSRFLTSSQSTLPGPVAAFVERLRGGFGYHNLGWWVVGTQTLAVLEVVHAALGLVRSGVGITGMQVFSRLWSVWGLLYPIPDCRDSPFFTTMVFAWSLTEVIRYSFYASSLLGITVPGLNYLRYTLFIVLYPLGASSEAFLSFGTLPPFSTFPLLPQSIKNLSPLSTLLRLLPSSVGKAAMKSEWGRRVFWNMAKAGAKSKGAVGRAWTLMDFVKLTFFFVWWPSLYMLMSYMSRQRRKVLGTGRRVGSKTKTM